MTTYTAISAAEIDGDSPLTDTLMSRLRDNPIAIAEGAAGAPRNAFESLGNWYTNAGGVGTYVFANGAVDKAFGGTVAGSTLTPTSAAYGETAGGDNGFFDTGGALSGTWQCMGKFDLTRTSGGGNVLGATLWQRIA